MKEITRARCERKRKSITHMFYLGDMEIDSTAGDFIPTSARESHISWFRVQFGISKFELFEKHTANQNKQE
jgi:hypothetical protein